MWFAFLLKSRLYKYFDVFGNFYINAKLKNFHNFNTEEDDKFLIRIFENIFIQEKDYVVHTFNFIRNFTLNKKELHIFEIMNIPLQRHMKWKSNGNFHSKT